MKRVYIKSLGVLSAAGNDLRENIASLEEDKSGIGMSSVDGSVLRLPMGRVKFFDSELLDRLALYAGILHLEDSLDELEREYRHGGEFLLPRTDLLAMTAFAEALTGYLSGDGTCDDGTSFAGSALSAHGIGLISATSTGGMDLTERFWEAHRSDYQDFCMSGDCSVTDWYRNHPCGRINDLICRFFKIEPEISTVISTACSSAANAIMLGARMIRSGRLERVIVGGSDALSRFTINGFNSLRIYDNEYCKPFSSKRAGLNLGEGAGYLVLDSSAESALCEVSGWANVNEAFHQTGSSPDGSGPRAAMLGAMRVAGLNPQDIGYINPHGTATPGNDLSEMAALESIFGDEIPYVDPLKHLYGHTLAASEAIEAAMCACLLSGKADMSYRLAARAAKDHEVDMLEGKSRYSAPHALVNPGHVLSNAFGFAGNQTSLIFSAV